MLTLKNFKFWLLVSIGIIYVYLVWLFHWVSSDGMSVVIQSYNVINGLGLVWNFGERSFVSTSPLFTLVSIPLTYVFDLIFDLFKVTSNKFVYIPIIINVIFAVATIFAILKYSFFKIKTFSIWKLAIVLVVFYLFLSSKFYIDFSTSGLENSLSYLVISLFTIAAFHEETSKSKFLLPILASLVFLTRYDFLLIISPALIYYIYKNGITKGFVLMSIIISCWFIFSFIYFGSIFPNSFYIKARGFNLHQSLFYFKKNIFESPKIFILLALGFYSSYHINKRIFVGMVCYFCYIFMVKDYMFGRLFTILVPIAVISVIQYISMHGILDEKNKNFLKASFATVIISVIVYFVPSIKSLCLDEIAKGAFGLSNERDYYTVKENLFKVNFTYNKPSSITTSVNTNGSMLHAPLLPENINKYFLDPVGLATPFMTYYIKNYGSSGSRPGHSYANIEYLKENCVFETLIGKKNIIQDKNLHELYEDVKIVSSRELFDPKRLETIIKLNTHTYHNK